LQDRQKNGSKTWDNKSPKGNIMRKISVLDARQYPLQRMSTNEESVPCEVGSLKNFSSSKNGDHVTTKQTENKSTNLLLAAEELFFDQRLK